jgi:hypothetical protein
MTTIQTLLNVATATIVTAGMSRQPLSETRPKPVFLSVRLDKYLRAVRLIPATDELSEEYAKWKVFQRISGSKKPCDS